METTSSQESTLTLQIIGYGSIRLARKFATKENLCKLTGLPYEQLIIANEEGDEVEILDDSLPPGTTFTIVSEEDLHDYDEEGHEQEQEHTQNNVELKHQLKIDKRNQRVLQMQQERVKMIKQHYQPLHPHLYLFKESEVLSPAFVKALNQSDMLNYVKKHTETGLFSFEMLQPKFCTEFLEEVENFERSGLPLLRPNTMNNYGVVLDEMGFEDFLMTLQETYVKPVATLLYGGIGNEIDSHHAFIVEYKIGLDEKLDFHYDASDVTINVCLGKTFTGGELYFAGLLDKPDTHTEYFKIGHTPGSGLIHLGKHRHGATSITSGERTNLIIWFRNAHLHQHGECSCEHHDN